MKREAAQRACKEEPSDHFRGEKWLLTSLADEELATRMLGELARPQFLAIVSASVLATKLARKSNPAPDGFVIESSTGGGHNPPARGAIQLDEIGQPIYGPRDQPEMSDIHEVGTASRTSEALALGATGIQVGIAFAFATNRG